MARTLHILGNWKQNLLRAEARVLAEAVAVGLAEARAGVERVRVGVAPTYVSLETVRVQCGEGPDAVRLLAQDVAAQESGAYTGEVGPAMLRDVGVRASIIGHSERRTHFGDTDEVVARKLRCALDGGLDVVLCVGEQLEHRDAGEHEKVVISQLSAALSQLSPKLDASRVILAYEPVWAIGTGRTATPEQASEMHAVIRAWLAQHQLAAADRSILYGGSVKPHNAAALLAAGEIDGFLVGGASLDARSFLDIVAAASSHAHSSDST